MEGDNFIADDGPRWLRPTILQKGLGLVLIPLLLQVVFFWQFYALVDKTEALNQAEMHQSALVEQLNKLMQIFTIAWGSILAEAIESNQIGAIDESTYLRQVDEGLVRIKTLSPSQSFTDIMDQAQEMSRLQAKLLHEFSQTSPDEPAIAVYAKVRALKMTFKPYMKKAKSIDEVLSVERRKLDQAQQVAAENRRSLKTKLLIGVGLDIAITLALLVFLLKNISHRLSLLVGNARLLPSGQALPASVSGHDELAYLDRILHQAANELEKAAAYRKSMMETMSHDLRSPIQSALITAEILENLPIAASTPAAAKHLGALKRNLSRVVQLVEDHLTIDKLEAGMAELEIESFDLCQAVAEALDGVAAQAAQKSIELINKVDPVLIEADRGKVLQILANYLTNAIKYSPRSAPIFVSSQNLGNSVKVMILDDGPGMDSEAQNQVYGRFQQNSKDGMSRGGFGLGLHICQLLVSHHGGRVGVTSSPGKGSTFWFILPLKYVG